MGLYTVSCIIQNLWINIAGDTFFMEGNKEKEKKKKAMQYVYTELVESPSENHY